MGFIFNIIGASVGLGNIWRFSFLPFLYEFVKNRLVIFIYNLFYSILVKCNLRLLNYVLLKISFNNTHNFPFSGDCFGRRR